jgi:hypothetical protein
MQPPSRSAGIPTIECENGNYLLSRWEQTSTLPLSGNLEAFNAKAELERKTAKDAAESTGAHKSATAAGCNDRAHGSKRMKTHRKVMLVDVRE